MFFLYVRNKTVLFRKLRHSVYL